MTHNVVDPPFVTWPRQWLEDPEIRESLYFIDRFLMAMWTRSGGSQDELAHLLERTVTAGNGLTGGGDLSADRAFAIDTSVVLDISAIATYAPTNVTTVRAFDANATSLEELADVLGTLLIDMTVT